MPARTDGPFGGIFGWPSASAFTGDIACVSESAMQRTAYTLLVFTTLFWACNTIAGKIAVGHVSPMALNALRWAVALALVTALGWRHLARDWPLIRARLPWLVALGTAGFTLFNAALYQALVYTSSVNAAIEQAAIPLVIFVANFIVYRIAATWAQIAGFVMSVAGIVIVTTAGQPARLLALDIMLVAILVYGGYTVALRSKPAIHWMSMMIVLCATATVTSLPLMAAEAAWDTLILPDATGWALIVFTALFPSALAQAFYIRGVEMIGANRAGLFINLVPIFATALAVLLLGEAFRAHHALALGLVFGGIWLAERGR
jgi:drug/metabolite transporter (DMT)-like permease